jgi:hypothetical protein
MWQDGKRGAIGHAAPASASSAASMSEYPAPLPSLAPCSLTATLPQTMRSIARIWLMAMPGAIRAATVRSAASTAGTGRLHGSSR